MIIINTNTFLSLGIIKKMGDIRICCHIERSWEVISTTLYVTVQRARNAKLVLINHFHLPIFFINPLSFYDKVTYIIAKHYIGHICYSMRIRNLQPKSLNSSHHAIYNYTIRITFSSVCVYCRQLHQQCRQ